MALSEGHSGAVSGAETHAVTAPDEGVVLCAGCRFDGWIGSDGG